MNKKLLWQMVTDAPFNPGVVGATDNAITNEIELQVIRKLIRSTTLRITKKIITSTGVWSDVAEKYEHSLPDDVLKVLGVSANYTQTLRSILSCSEEITITYFSDAMCRTPAGIESIIFWRSAAKLVTKLTANKKTAKAMNQFADVLERYAVRMDNRQVRISAKTGSMTLQSRRNPWYTGNRKTFGTNSKRYK